MHRATWFIGWVSIAAVATSTRPAHALGPVDVEVGAKAGAGTNPYGGAPNPLGFGLGGRAGVVLFDHLYGGINLMYYFGGSETSPGGPGTVTESRHMLMYGVEAGWGFKLLDVLTIRPQVGLGNAAFSSSVSAPSTFSSGIDEVPTRPNNLYVEPGVTVLLSLGTLFVGADANALVFPGLPQGNAVFTIHGQVGVKF
jgi:hypothetical protein